MSGTISTTDYEAILDDIGALLRGLGLGDHARHASPHNVFLDEILPAVETLRAQFAEAQAENGRLQSIVDQEIGSALDRAEKAVLNRDAGYKAGAEDAAAKYAAALEVAEAADAHHEADRAHGLNSTQEARAHRALMDALARYRTARDTTQGETNG